MISCIRSASALGDVLAAQKTAQAQERPVAAAVRIDRLKRVAALIKKHQHKFTTAASADFGVRHPVQTRMELMATADSAKYAASHVKRWMKPRKAKLPLPLRLLGARGEEYRQPLGVVGIVTPWNFPFTLALSPLAGVFAAGNRAMVKLSELAPASAEAIAEAITEYFDPLELTTVIGDAEMGRAFSALPFDHLLFTGSPQVGHHVMRAAAEHLTPVTLELGGKCPVVIDRSAALDVATRRVLAGKIQNAGQICLAPDTAFVPRESLEDFVGHARDVIAGWFPTIRDNPDYVSMIDQRSYDRVAGYLEEATRNNVRVEPLGPREDLTGQPHRKIAPTIVVDPADRLAISQDEIFGPVLVVRTYESVDEIIAYLDERERPLALYYFGRAKKTARLLRDRTISGGMTVDDVLMHAAIEDLPLGGVGNSGMGAYHGRVGFDTFSHAKYLYYQGVLSPAGLFAPPYLPRHHKLIDRMLGRSGVN